MITKTWSRWGKRATDAAAPLTWLGPAPALAETGPIARPARKAVAAATAHAGRPSRRRPFGALRPADGPELSASSDLRGAGRVLRIMCWYLLRTETGAVGGRDRKRPQSPQIRAVTLVTLGKARGRDKHSAVNASRRALELPSHPVGRLGSSSGKTTFSITAR